MKIVIIGSAIDQDPVSYEVAGNNDGKLFFRWKIGNLIHTREVLNKEVLSQNVSQVSSNAPSDFPSDLKSSLSGHHSNTPYWGRIVDFLLEHPDTDLGDRDHVIVVNLHNEEVFLGGADYSS